MNILLFSVGSIIASFTMDTIYLLRQHKDLADIGYILDSNGVFRKNVDANPQGMNNNLMVMFIPGLNVAWEFYKLINYVKNRDAIIASFQISDSVIKMNDEQEQRYKEKPTGFKAYLIYLQKLEEERLLDEYNSLSEEQKEALYNLRKSAFPEEVVATFYDKLKNTYDVETLKGGLIKAIDNQFLDDREYVLVKQAFYRRLNELEAGKYEDKIKKFEVLYKEAATEERKKDKKEYLVSIGYGIDDDTNDEPTIMEAVEGKNKEYVKVIGNECIHNIDARYESDATRHARFIEKEMSKPGFARKRERDNYKKSRK